MLSLAAGKLLRGFTAAADAAWRHLLSVALRDAANARLAALLSEPGACPAAEPNFTSAPAADAALCLAAALCALVPVSLAARTCRAASRRTPAAGPGPRGPVPLPACGGPLLREAEPGVPASPCGAQRAALAPCPAADCLALHPRVPRALRLGLPLLVLADVCLFAAANAGVGVSVMLSVRADGEEVAKLPPLRDFGLVSSVKDMLDAEVYALALLIAVFSGVWPYAKLLWMLFCWFSPTSLLSAPRRQRLLDRLDALGKWSLHNTVHYDMI